MNANSLRHAMISLSGGVLNRVDPLGARCVMGAIEAQGESFGLLLEDRKIERDAIMRKLLDYNPEMLWVSIQPLTPEVFVFIRKLREFFPNTPLILGNVGARGFDGHELLGVGGQTVIVLGAGEEAVVKILEIFRTESSLPPSRLRDLANLRFVMDGVVVQTDFRPDGIRQTVVPSDFGLRENVDRGNVINARASSGCNAHCTFCTVRLINNGQSWQPLPPGILLNWLEKVIRAGKRTGTIAMTDDDLAGSLENLLSVAEAFHQVNRRWGTNLTFNFSTRANHLFDPKDSPEQDANRMRVWKYSVESGLKNVFLGLESGSESQLKRYGKGCSVGTNRRALARAKELGITIEIGFIPIDQMMLDDTWRKELWDNVALAREADVAYSCPTWLAPSRVYQGAPLAKHLKKHGLLGRLNPETEEYETRFASREVVRLLSWLGPALCEGDDNGYYRFKRELKAAIRYPMAVTPVIERYGRTIIARELDFAERLTFARDAEGALAAQTDFASQVLGLLIELQGQLLLAQDKAFAIEFLSFTAKASHTISHWLRGLLPAAAAAERDSLCQPELV